LNRREKENALASQMERSQTINLMTTDGNSRSEKFFISFCIVDMSKDIPKKLHFILQDIFI